MINWHGYFKRYVWDDDTTPYFTPVAKLSRQQADSELFFFALMLAVLFAIISFTSISGQAPYGVSLPAAIYAFTVVVAVVLVSSMKLAAAAAYCAGVPLVVLGLLVAVGFPEHMALVDELLVLAVDLLIFRYCFRVIAICRAYRDLPNRPSKRKLRRKLF